MSSVIKKKKNKQPRRQFSTTALIKSLLAQIPQQPKIITKKKKQTNLPSRQILPNTMRTSRSVQSQIYLYKADVKSQEEQTDSSISRNNFEFQLVIGKGAFGKVWKVTLKRSKQKFALKQMSKAMVLARKSVNSVLNQKVLLASLKSNFIANVYFAFQDRENLYLVMDWLSGGDLRYHLGKKKFSQKQAKFAFICILQGLQYLHSNSIIHRDIKPENLVYDQKGYLRITDLGISRIMRPQNSIDTSGTPGYMAPEVLCRQNYDYSIDFFALGIILFQIMLQQRPYYGSSRKQIRDQILSKQIQIKRTQIPIGWSLEAADMCNRLIQRKPTNRLGCNGIQQIKGHSWLKDVSWKKLANKQYQAPFVPKKYQPNFHQIQNTADDSKQLLQKNKILLRNYQYNALFEGYQYQNWIKTETKNGKKPFRKKEKPVLQHTKASSSTASSKNSSNILDLYDKLTKI